MSSTRFAEYNILSGKVPNSVPDPVDPFLISLGDPDP
jgi:hypothetical protein